MRKLTSLQKHLRRQIIEVSHKKRLSHLGSCFTSVDIIEAVYQVKKKNDVFVLSSGHAGVAWYVVLHKRGIISEKTLQKLYIHPDRNESQGISVSTGSLGQGLPIAVGLALAHRSRHIYCLISDGECAEGSIWEALHLTHQLKLVNLHILLNANGWGAYDPVDHDHLEQRLRATGLRVVKKNGHDLDGLIKTFRRSVKAPTIVIAETTVSQLPFLQGQDAHYHVMTEEEYRTALTLLA